MKKLSNWALIGILIGGSHSAIADFTGGPDPYAQGFGFDKPEQASWGGWSRDAIDTYYAEWDLFIDSALYGERSAIPDIGQNGAERIYLQWEAGSFVTGSGNLYSFSVPQQFKIELSEVNSTSGLRAVLQLETLGPGFNIESIQMNGRRPDFHAATFTDANFETFIGPTELNHRLYYWDLSASDQTLVFEFDAAAHMSLSQVAVDVGRVKKQARADIDNGTLTVPCTEVRKSPFDGRYDVSLQTTMPGNSENWQVVSATNADCAAVEEVLPSHRWLQSTGLLGTQKLDSENTVQINQNSIADFAYQLFLLPCVEVKAESTMTYYHIALEMADDGGMNWRLRDAVLTDANECQYREPDIASDNH
ncbi:MAG: hypothetical protein Kow0065_24550 [Methylomicrobium sp.]